MSNKERPINFSAPMVRALAAAADKDGQHIYTHWRDSNAHKANELWCQAASPELVVGLLDSIAELEAQQALKPLTDADQWDAKLGRVAMRFVDRAGDVHPGIDDAEKICADFHAAMSSVIDEIPWVKRMQRSATNCQCLTCRPISPTDPESMRMALCPQCGNKRCPKANDHRHACTGSNEPGQHGSAYPAHGITAAQKGCNP